MGKLTDRQKRFIAEYLVDLNATQAAIRAGYSEKTAKQIGSDNLSKIDIKTEIERRQGKTSAKLEITQEAVVRELAAIAFANGTDFAVVGKRNRVTITPTDELDPVKRSAVASIKKGKFGTEIRTYDKVRALELLGRHLGMFNGDAPDGGDDKVDELLERIEDHATDKLETD